MITALYARTSTDLQATGLESQIRALESYCTNKGITDIRIYSDAGISGSKASRPGLNQLIHDLKSGIIETVVCYSLSRLSRSTRHLLETLELLKSNKVGFVSLSEAFDASTPMGTLMITVLAAVAQLEREIIVERIKTGMINAKAKGKKIGRPRAHEDKLSLIQHLSNEGKNHREISQISGVSRATISRLLKQKNDQSK